MTDLPCDCEPGDDITDEAVAALQAMAAPFLAGQSWHVIGGAEPETWLAHPRIRASVLANHEITRAMKDHFFDALSEAAASAVFDGRLAEDVVAAERAPKTIDQMTLADYRRAIERRWPKRRRD